jgi:hypothetical protein
MMNIMSDGEQTGIAGITRRQLRLASADAELDERTSMRALCGYPVRSGGRERLLTALRALGADVSGVPEPYVTGKIETDADDLHRGRR